MTREYEMVEELPYGKQAQADFGEYNMRNGLGERIKVFKQVIENTEKTIVQRALDYCCDNQVLSANDFKAVAEQFKRDEFSFHQPASKIVYMNLLGKLPAVALTEPATSSIEDYETILKIKP